MTFDLRYRRLRWGSKWGAWTAWRTDTTAVSGSLPIAAGRHTCVSVRARDDDGRTSRWSRERCATAPFDDRSLGRSGRWRELVHPALYRGTGLRTSSHGARLTLPKVPDFTGVYLVATTCPTCGEVKVSWGWGSRTISLASDTVQPQQLIQFRRFSDDLNPGTSVITVTVLSSHKKVVVDGLLIAGPPPT